MEDNYLAMDPYRIGNDKRLDASPKTQGLEDNLIDKVLSDKLNSIKDHIRQILELIQERKIIQCNVLSGLENAVNKVRGIIFSSGSPVMGYDTVELRTRDDLDSLIIDLEKAMIEEDVNAWRDVLDLKKELIELRKELKSAESKVQLFKSSKR